MESGLLDPRRLIQTTSHVLRPNKFPSHIPDNDESHLSSASHTGMALGLYG